MSEKPLRHPIPVFSHQIDVYNPRNITPPLLQDEQGNQYRDTSDIQDALALIRQGIYELVGMNGLPATLDNQSDCSLSVGEDGLSIVQWNTQKKIQDDALNKAQTDEDKEKALRDSFLVIDRNTKDGIIGAAEGRIYTFAGTGEKALIVHWVATRATGSGDEDKYSYRGAGVAAAMYDRIEELAGQHNVKLMIAAVNPQNTASRRFHEGRGMHVEVFNPELASEYDEDGNPRAYKTDNGAYIPPYIFGRDENNVPTHYAEYYTKRMHSPQPSEQEKT